MDYKRKSMYDEMVLLKKLWKATDKIENTKKEIWYCNDIFERTKEMVENIKYIEEENGENRMGK